jgi:transposase
LDNARIHHYKKLKKFIKNQTNINFIYNVPYSPQFNPIEFVFKDAKQILKNKNITKSNIIKKIMLAFKNIKSINIQKYYKNSLFLINSSFLAMFES